MVALVMVQIFVLCDARPGWRVGFCLRVLATIGMNVFALVSVQSPGKRWDINLTMTVAFAVFWETTYLRSVTVDVQWWHDQDGKLWLFYLALLLLNQGALLDRLVGELRQVLCPTRAIACCQCMCESDDHV